MNSLRRFISYKGRKFDEETPLPIHEDVHSTMEFLISTIESSSDQHRTSDEVWQSISVNSKKLTNVKNLFLKLSNDEGLERRKMSRQAVPNLVLDVKETSMLTNHLSMPHRRNMNLSKKRSFTPEPSSELELTSPELEMLNNFDYRFQRDDFELNTIVEVEFSVLVPEYLPSENEKIKILFKIEDFHELFILKSEQYFEKVNNFTKITNIVSIPLFIIKANRKINYIYYSTNGDEVSLLENLFMEMKKLRSIDNHFLKIIIESYTSTRRHFLQFDGFALFGSTSYTEKKEACRNLKKDIIRNSIQVTKLRTKEFMNSYSHFLESIFRTYECLCKHDYEYWTDFQGQMVDEFLKTQQRLDLFRHKPTEDWEYLAVLTMFFCTYKCNLLSKFQVKQWLNYLFRFLDVQSIYYYNALLDIFEYHIKDLSFALETFLEENQNTHHNPYGVNALTIYYLINKKSDIDHAEDPSNRAFHQKKSKHKLESDQQDLSQFIRFALPNKNFKELRQLKRNFIQYFDTDHNLGTIFLNYFLHNNPGNLKTIFHDDNIIPKYMTVLRYLNVLMTNKSLIDSKDKEIIVTCSYDLTNSLVEEIMNTKHLQYNSEALNEMIRVLKMSRLLLKNALNNSSDDYRIIGPILQLCLAFFQFVESNCNYTQNYQQSAEMNEIFDELIENIDDFLNKSNQSFLFSCGLKLEQLNDLAKNSLQKSTKRDKTSGNQRPVTREYNELEFYQHFLSAEFPMDVMNAKKKFKQNIFFDQIMRLLGNRLNNSSLYEIVTIRALASFNNNTHLIKQFDNHVLYKMNHEDIEQSINVLCSCLLDPRDNSKLLQYYMENILSKKWPNKDEQILEFILNSKLLLTTYKWSSKCNLLSHNWTQKVYRALDILVDSVNRVASGNANIKTIMLLRDNYDIVSQIASLMKMNKFKTKINVELSDLRKLFEYRRREVDKFKQYTNSIKAFFQLCAIFNIRTTPYSTKVEALYKSNRSINETVLNTVCKCESLKNIINASNTKLEPNIFYYDNITNQKVSLIDTINGLKRLQCVIFDSHFNNSCIEIKKERNASSISIIEVLDEVFPRTIKKWQVLANIIENGTIKLVEIDDYQNKYFQNNFKKMFAEMEYICEYFKIRCLAERMTQLERYNRFRSITEAAESIEEIRTLLNLKSQFTELAALLSVKTTKFRDWTILKMDMDIEETIQILKRMNSPMKLNCLQAFLKSMEFVKWLRNSTKNINELKFLVDIVSMGKEKGTNNDLLAKALKEAGVAFAPLIFDLHENTKFKEFMALCEIVWSYLETDKNICDKLIYFGKDKIDQLESIRSQKGNVELSSINKAKQFNLNGVYTIGNFKTSFISANGVVNLDQTTAISNLIEFEIELVNAGKKAEKKNYTYDDLKELQNILLLVAKKDEIDNDEKDLEYFIEIFNNVVRLARIYLKLLRTGCDLFENFVTHVYCDISNQHVLNGRPTVTFTVNSKFSSGGRMQRLIENRTESTSVCLKKVCDYMETCFEMWQRHLITLRNSYTYINYFDTNQIIYLRANLGEIFYPDFTTKAEKSEVDLEMIGFLLTNICSNVTKEKLYNAFKKSLKWKPRSVESGAKQTSSTEDKQKDQFINEIKKENNFSVAVVRRAVNIYGTGDKSAVIDYCLENDDFDVDEITSSYDTMNMSIDEVKEEPMDLEETFNQRIELIWKRFLEKQKTYSNSFLTTEHLAKFLEILYENTNDFQRQIPGYLTNKGNPNFIVCPAKDQISILLSIYAHSHDQPLPSNDEILYCNKTTTNEQVENFFRIAFKSNGHRIYTILNIQEISYRNSEQIEKFIATNMQISQTNNYNLVCICSQEKQSESILATSLARYKVKAIILPQVNIEEYLAPKFKQASGKKSLSNYDFENSNVRVLMSQKPGNGKSTYVKVLRTRMKTKHNYKCIRIKSNTLNCDHELDKLFKMRCDSSPDQPTLFHIDIAFEVFYNVDLFLCNLLIIGGLKHSNGLIWRRNTRDLYLIEIMPPFLNNSTMHTTPYAYHSILNYLPKINFRNPRSYLYDIVSLNEVALKKLQDYLFEDHYKTIKFQRSCFYLKILRESPSDFARFYYHNRVELNYSDTLSQSECLRILLEYSELKSPNWSELYSFVNFLDAQLEVLEKTEFLKTIPDFKVIFTNLIIMMSYDFGLPSLNIGEESSALSISENNQVQISMHLLEMSRKWENMTHPYIIFNADHTTFTFMGIYVDRKHYKFVNPNTNEIIDLPELELKSNMRIALLTQRVPIFENFNNFPRTKKINNIRIVMGLNQPDQLGFDPDPTYQLTMDNSLKLMAIFMRLRCNNPVVIMGETGCGKTRMIKYLSDLHLRSTVIQVQHLIHVKIHGGTTAKEIANKVDQAERLARGNRPKLLGTRGHNNNRNDTPAMAILFFDEANTTENIGLIKEIMCDKTCNGREIDFSCGLKIIAAVNPYKKHSDEMILKLEEAGLGFYVSSADTMEKIGHIPMRQLVYRVQPLPSSMLPLVWDFGQLDSNTENVYILQLLKQRLKSKQIIKIPSESETEIIGKLLTKSQEFMRQQNDECSFVSLRDIERVIKVAEWFISNSDLLFNRMSKKKLDDFDDSYQVYLTPLRRAFVLALYVCYHAALSQKETRFAYRKLLAEIIPISEFDFARGSNDWIHCEILKSQHIFLDEANLKDNIARNNALLENVFMMIVCISLVIPLFIVGKPGSSKSLAKTVVSNLMQGQNSKSALFKKLKETYFVNFQCSPLTSSEMIVGSFQEAARFQKDSDLDKSVAVVNLDEIGLAEGSESMPLKALHSLLEEGTDTDEVALPHQKVGMIAISNWSLDPAKMNRGIFVSRGEPDIDELIESAKGICKYDQHIFNCIEPHIRDIAESYLDVCQLARQYKREFFGLRDFYSLIKMLYWFCTKDGNFTWSKLEHGVRRNFGGLGIDVIEPFRERLFTKLDSSVNDLGSSPINLITAALHGDNVESNSRYCLFITQNYSLIDMIQSYITNVMKIPTQKLVVIFGSSFKHDQEYTEIVRNISRIKQCMELGYTVILLNNPNLFESLYDALNQYYHEFAGQNYVYLGLGTHRVNCFVHEDFRLIVIANKDSVYDSKLFPIPLLNRLEKQFLNAIDLISDNQRELLNKLTSWTELFCQTLGAQKGFKPQTNEIFIGLNEDTIATLILSLTEKDFSMETIEEVDYMDEEDRESNNEILMKKIKQILLRCATADSIVRLSHPQATMELQKDNIWEEYFEHQKHSSLKDLIKNHMRIEETKQSKNLLQITTNSKSFMSNQNLNDLASGLDVHEKTYCLLNSFETQNQLASQIKKFLESQLRDKKRRMLVIQADYTLKNSADIATARHTIVEQIKETPILSNSYVLFFINLTRENLKHFIGFQVGYWTCYHVDELDETSDYLPSFDLLKGNSLSNILKTGLTALEAPDAKTINLKTLLVNITHTACSLITDTNIDRTIYRIELFLKLCTNNDFVRAIINRLINLQEEKEKNFIWGDKCNNWLVREVADIKNIQQYSSLKRSCQNYFETKLSPLLAYILSYVDYYSNLDIFATATGDQVWISKLWLNIFNNQDVCKLPYNNMRTTSNHSEELKEFLCKSNPLKRRFNSQNETRLVPILPFAWHLIDQLSEFYSSFIESTKTFFASKQHKDVSGSNLERYVNTMPGLLTNTKIYQLIQEVFTDHPNINGEQFLDLYINDFVLFKCPIKSKKDLDSIKIAVKSLITSLKIDMSNLQLALPLVHFEFENIHEKIISYLKFSEFEPKLNEHIRTLANFNEIDLDSCLGSIKIFQQTLQNTDIFDTLKRLRKLSQLIKSTLSKFRTAPTDAIKLKYDQVLKKFDVLRVNYLFMDNVLMHEYSFKQDVMIKFLCSLANMLKIKYLKSAQSSGIATGFDKKCLEDVHEFLGKCVAKAREVLFLTNTISQCCQQKCSRYKLVLNSDCACENCIVCEECELKMISMLNGNATVCLVCRKNIHLNQNGSGEFSYDMEDIENPYNELLENLNKFYASIVELLFLNERSPAENIIEAILRVITEGRIDTLTESGRHTLSIKSTFKSIILQTIFKNYSSQVQGHFNKWFTKCSNLFSSASELAFFFQTCVYDKHFHEQTSMSGDEQLKFGLNLCNELLDSKNSIRIMFKEMKNVQGYKVDYLVLVGKLKCCMEIMAYFCNSPESVSEVTDRSRYEEFNERMRRLFEEVNEDTIYNYLIKILIRKYGSGSIKYVLGSEKSKWITPNRIIGDDLKVIDRYVLIENADYNRFKTLISECFEDNSAEKFETYINAISNSSAFFPYLCMALYQNITLLYREMPNIPYRIFEPILDKTYGHQQLHWKPLLQNSLNHRLAINENTWGNVELNLLLIQLKYSILFSKSKLIKPFIDLIKSPSRYQNSFLPTMPHDSIFDIKNAIIAGNQNEAPKFYKCPKGHPYVLFDCGRPWVVHTCKECGAQIVGKNHVLLTDNEEMSIVDNTKRGYCLKDSASMKDEPTTERSLNSTQFSLVRFFLHACLYFSIDQNEEGVALIMSDQPRDKREFFWNHMNLDLRIAAKTLNLNKDEIMLLLHMVCKEILKSYNNSKPETWNTKEERLHWECAFSDVFLKQVLNNPDQVITKVTTALNSEKDQNKKEEDQSKKVYFMAYERFEDETKEAFAYEDPKFWKYMPNVSFNMLKIELFKSTQPEQHQILKKFIEMSDKLNLLKHLPDIVKFINLLEEKYNKSLFKHYANKNSINDVINSKLLDSAEYSLHEIKNIIKSFQTVWDSVKNDLTNHLRERNLTHLLDLEYEFNMDSKLSCFLPALHGDGLNTYGMMHYLATIQNEMLSMYYKKKSIEFDEIEITQINNIDSVISFTINGDLLQIIQSNFRYDAKNSKCEFNYDQITNQIIERFFQSRPQVDMQRMFIFEYADEIRNSAIFNKLHEIVPQQNLELIIQADVFNDFKNVNEISEALNIIKTIIKFGKATSANSDQYVAMFLKKIYVENSRRNFEQILGVKIVENCQMKHLKHICVLLMMKKALLNTFSGQDSFENLSGIFKQEKEFDLTLSFNPVSIVSLALVVYQMVSFFLNTLEDEDLMHYSEYKIREMMCSLEDSADILLPDNIYELAYLIPESIEMKHINVVWKKLTDYIRLNSNRYE